MYFIDDHSSLIMLYFLKQVQHFACYNEISDITPYDHIKCLWTDNGTEVTSEPFQWLLVLNRSKHEHTAPYFLD